MQTGYARYLKQLYDKANAAWRRQERKNFKPCEVCGEDPAEINADGIWRCRPCKATWNAIQNRVIPYEERLTKLGVPFLSKEDWEVGKKPPKKKRKAPDVKVPYQEWQYSVGKTGTAKRSTSTAKKAPTKSVAPKATSKPKATKSSTVIGTVIGSIKKK